MIKLARKYGLSDVGLAKICRKHNIPRPPRGYWAKVQNGMAQSQTPLSDPDSDYAIAMYNPDEVRINSSELKQEVEATVARESEESQKISVSDNLRGSHHLVSSANALLQKAETDEIGLINTEGTGLDAEVSKNSLHRALTIFDAILKALASRGYTTERGPTVKIFDTTVKFGISEQVSTIKEEPDDPDLEGRYVFSHSRFKRKTVPSGKLTLSINEGGGYYEDWSKGCRKIWRDTKRQMLEDRLNEFVGGLIEVAARKHEHEEKKARLEEERRKEREREEAERQRKAAIHQRAKQERARVESLFDSADAWDRSERLRAYIEVATNQHIQEHGEIAPDSEFARWREWAMQQADRNDPLAKSPPSILDEDDGVDREPNSRWRW
jgi:hypothetical protein